MKIIDLVFGLNGAAKADDAYKKNCKEAEELTRRIRKMRDDEERGLKGVAEEGRTGA